MSPLLPSPPTAGRQRPPAAQSPVAAQRSAAQCSAAQCSATQRPRRLHRRLGGALAALFALLAGGAPPPAAAFPHIVQEGETLAAIAERYYGRIQHERVLVVANGLDRGQLSTISAGMVLDVPTVTHHRVAPGDTWESLATRFLGAPKRATYLSLANDLKPWIPPEVGSILKIPYNLALLSSGNDSLSTIAYRYLGSTKGAWSISNYNQLEDRKLQRGDVLLVPLIDLPLTEAGRAAARAAATALGSAADAPERVQQVKLQGEVPALIADVRGGRYVPAVARGVRLLSSGELSEQQRARIYRQLLEAYVALDSTGQAVDACGHWRRLEPDARLDPVVLSPKILAACARVPPPEPAPTAAEPGAPAPAAPPPTGRAPTADDPR